MPVEWGWSMANLLRWYKRDHNAALEGMAVLTLEERGAYTTVLDLIYAHDGSVDDHDRFIAGWLRVDVRVWRRIRSRLMELGKLYVHGGKLRNERADREVRDALDKIASSQQAGLASSAKRAADRSIIKGLASTTVERASQTPTPTTRKLTSSRLGSRAREDFETGDTSCQARPSDLSRSELEATFRKRKHVGVAE
jgi:uncharacterized protein YdaU (DUF1376 family)